MAIYSWFKIVIFDSYVSLPEGTEIQCHCHPRAAPTFNSRPPLADNGGQSSWDGSDDSPKWNPPNDYTAAI
jgi:hypothetical protein